MATRASSLRWRLTAAVGTALTVAVLAPVVVWVTSIAPTVWASPRFLGLLFAGILALFVASLVVARWLAVSITAPIAAAAKRIEFIADTGGDIPGSPRQSVEEVERLLAAVKHLIDASRVRERRFETAIGALAHDVRTDLRAIATVLAQGRAEPDGALVLSAATATLVEKEIARVRSMTSDLVLLMRGSESATSDRSMVEVSDLVREIIASIGVDAGLRVTVQVEKDFVRPGPRALIERILRNVLDNAVRHGRSSVTVRVFDGLVVVADDGPGMSQHRREGGGTGLHGYGFQIASRLAELIGGRVAIERSGPTGTVVLVYL